jgi:saccharopine dehydrogenase-like NADP-dependent oxidoreductase
MKKVVVLGAGLVGKAIAIDLAKTFSVRSVDINSKDLDALKGRENIQIQQSDLSNEKNLSESVKEADIVVNALPGYMGFNATKMVINEGKDIVDISFFPEDPFKLDKLAKEKKVTAVTDCGVAPGMGNIICGYLDKIMKIHDYKCFVGGLPMVREWPHEYRAVFSPADVIEEYTRPARYVVNGGVVIKDALSDTEYLNFDGIGTLEAFNSDGLRSLITTMRIPNMIEKTMRFPGTVERLKVLREIGFFSKDEIEVKGQKVVPLNFTSAILFPKWKLGAGEKEFTVMRVICEGVESGTKVKYTFDLNDVYDSVTDTTSMARTTGYTCTAVVNMIAEGLYTYKGISPPEYVATNRANFDYIIKYLSNRGVEYKMKKEKTEE